jgi:hypothetical protein
MPTTHDTSDDTREIDLAAVEAAYAEAVTETGIEYLTPRQSWDRAQQEAEAERVRKLLWAVGD